MTLEQFLNTKTMKFRKIDLNICPATRKSYRITARYRDKYVTAYTYDKEVFFFFYKDEYKVKHLEAKRHCYNRIVKAFNLSL